MFDIYVFACNSHFWNPTIEDAEVCITQYSVGPISEMASSSLTKGLQLADWSKMTFRYHNRNQSLSKKLALYLHYNLGECTILQADLFSSDVLHWSGVVIILQVIR